MGPTSSAIDVQTTELLSACAGEGERESREFRRRRSLATKVRARAIGDAAFSVARLISSACDWEGGGWLR